MSVDMPIGTVQMPRSSDGRRLSVLSPTAGSRGRIPSFCIGKQNMGVAPLNVRARLFGLAIGVAPASARVARISERAPTAAILTREDDLEPTDH